MSDFGRNALLPTCYYYKKTSEFDRKLNVVRIRFMLTENELPAEAEQGNDPDQAPKEIIKSRTMFTGREKQALNNALTRFISCGRCSLFLASYRLNHDDAELQTAVNNIDDGWIILPWDLSMRALISKSYGCRIDVEAYHFESWCPDCHGPFVYSEPDNGQPYILRVKM